MKLQTRLATIFTVFRYIWTQKITVSRMKMTKFSCIPITNLFQRGLTNGLIRVYKLTGYFTGTTGNNNACIVETQTNVG